MAMGIASTNRRVSAVGPTPAFRPALSFFATGPPSGGAAAEPGVGSTRPFVVRQRSSNRVWAIERVGPPPEPNPPDQLAKVALLWADATMLVLAALGAALLVAALVL